MTEKGRHSLEIDGQRRVKYLRRLVPLVSLLIIVLLGLLSYAKTQPEATKSSELDSNAGSLFQNHPSTILVSPSTTAPAGSSTSGSRPRSATASTAPVVPTSTITPKPVDTQSPLRQRDSPPEDAAAVYSFFAGGGGGPCLENPSSDPPAITIAGATELATRFEICLHAFNHQELSTVMITRPDGTTISRSDHFGITYPSAPSDVVGTYEVHATRARWWQAKYCDAVAYGETNA